MGTENEQNAAAEVAAQHAQIGNFDTPVNADFKRNKHPDAQWFPEAGMGLFLHWGISSVLGEGDLSWSMIYSNRDSRGKNAAAHGLYAAQNKMSPAKYWAQAAGFKADRFDPVKILTAAKKAGVKYAILTTRHHDGFALWPSKHGDFNIGKYLQGRDLVREYVEACREVGIKIGLYFSPPDWYFNQHRMSFNYGDQLPALDIHHQPIPLPSDYNPSASEGGRPAYLSTISKEENEEMDRQYKAYIRGQIEELLTNYGPIDIFWFDGFAQNAISREEIRQLQPGILMNNRGYAGQPGDYRTPECAFPKERIEGWWEYCHVFADGAWGYLNHETYKPSGWVLGELAKARAWGGNFVPNVAPDAHGEMPAAYYKRMEQIAQWMETGAESVFGVEPGPWPEKSNVPVTIRGNTWYLHFDFLSNGLATLKDVAEPVETRLLRTGEKVDFSYSGGVLNLDLPNDLRTSLDDVVVLKFRN